MKSLQSKVSKLARKVKQLRDNSVTVQRDGHDKPSRWTVTLWSLSSIKHRFEKAPGLQAVLMVLSMAKLGEVKE